MKSLISQSELPLRQEPADGRGTPSGLAHEARLVLEIAPGERRLLPEFGCRIHEVDFTREAAREVAGAFVEEALARWLPALRVQRALVGEPDGGRAQVRLEAQGEWHSFSITLRGLAARRREAIP